MNGGVGGVDEGVFNGGGGGVDLILSMIGEETSLFLEGVFKGTGGGNLFDDRLTFEGVLSGITG